MPIDENVTGGNERHCSQPTVWKTITALWLRRPSPVRKSSTGPLAGSSGAIEVFLGFCVITCPNTRRAYLRDVDRSYAPLTFSPVQLVAYQEKPR